MKLQSTLLGIASVAIVAFALKTTAVNAKPAGDAPAQVAIDNFKFTPPTLTVKAGTTVVFTNHDDVPHTVVADGQAFRSKALDTDDQYSYQFSKPGTYVYFCSLHPKMMGTVVVQ